MAENPPSGSKVEHQTHEALCYLSVRDRMDPHSPNSLWRRSTPIPIKLKTPLSSPLTQLSNRPAVSFTETHYKYIHGLSYRKSLAPIADISLRINGEHVGTFGCPDVGKIVEKSKSESLVVDHEGGHAPVVARDVGVGSPVQHEALYKIIEAHVSESMFLDTNKRVEIELYKLWVYGIGGHFDWRRETKRGDDHHATVLVALNTNWTGGNLVFKHEGTTVEVDMHADKAKEESSDDSEEEEAESDEPHETPTLGFHMVAFSTEIEHKLENITDGTLILLQFSVNLEALPPPDPNTYFYKENTDAFFKTGAGKAISKTTKPIFPYTFSVGPSTTREAAILSDLVTKIRYLHVSMLVDEVIFPMRHLYRNATIEPEHLQGVDAYLFEGLKNVNTFEVYLKPLMFVHKTDDEGGWEDDKDLFGFPFISEHDNLMKGRPAKKRKVVSEKRSEIHIPARYALVNIRSTEYMSMTGYETQLGEHWFFGGGMFVAKKETPGGRRK